FPEYIWSFDSQEKEVYLTFDDGPHPEITPWVLDQLKQYEAKASFFCIGNNVQKYPDVFELIRKEGHAIGNHTFHHLNGWKTSRNGYLSDIAKAAEWIDSSLFRPPYGRMKRRYARKLAASMSKEQVSIIMWDVLSADFDRSISSQQCLDNVINNYGPGSVIVFHDSEKAFPHLQQVLPAVLNDIKKKGYISKKIGL
ncbi:MAG TPA: polysaccharide deacetylase family protein, partial [Flavisolibacter sp.]|nr:polysaccharide deacetylase family protein [Flavisolibacter sp.]